MIPSFKRFWYAMLILMTIFACAASDQALVESEADLQSQITFYVH